ncbi:hypothetical protein TNCV_4901371 [Trichonephila clavipes]|nr:hypothetical protein TNCV_4901371 [Trichonephila clavipes]
MSMMGVEWSARRVPRQLDRSDCVLTVSTATIQAQVASSLGEYGLLEPYEGTWLYGIWDHGGHFMRCPRRLHLE